MNNELEGGRLAASVLLATIKEYLRTQHVDLNNTDIVLRAYANLVGLAQAYITKEHMNKGINLRLFMNGFTQKQALFDFVDVGSGKGIADHKIRRRISFFLYNSQPLLE